MSESFAAINFSNSFAALGGDFYSSVTPTPFTSEPRLIHFNHDAARLLDFDAAGYDNSELSRIFSGAKPMPGGQSISMLYAGHQFGHFVPQLGDGRAIILGEALNRDGDRWEIQLKGSGLTPYSRDGDGRAVLRSTIREYLCSEAMHALGIPSTRALCIVGSEDEVYRERIEPGAMLTRLAPSHVRFGSFEVFYYRNQFAQLYRLADYVIEHHFPQLIEAENRYPLLLQNVIDRTAALIAQWQAVGFSHGVMNSDNMSILGLTLDYGPYGFMESYNPGFICNHSDHHGRYAFDQQPSIGLFNLSCLAQAMLPLLCPASQEKAQSPDTFDEKEIAAAVETAKSLLDTYYQRYISYYAERMREKLGLQETLSEDQSLCDDLLKLMARDGADYTNVFRRLCDVKMAHDDDAPVSVRDYFIDRDALDHWLQRYRQRLLKENSQDKARSQRMKAVNPKYILRNYLAEIAIRKAEDDKDYSEIDRLLQVLKAPFAEHEQYQFYADLPPDWANNIVVSCSS